MGLCAFLLLVLPKECPTKNSGWFLAENLILPFGRPSYLEYHDDAAFPYLNRPIKISLARVAATFTPA